MWFPRACVWIELICSYLENTVSRDITVVPGVTVLLIKLAHRKGCKKVNIASEICANIESGN